MPTTNPPLSVAQVCELADGAWVNDGFTAVVRSIDQKQARATGRPFWVVVFGDTTGSASVEGSIFGVAPRFAVGDRVDVGGQGIKFKTSQYGGKVNIGEKAEIHVLGKGVTHEGQPQSRGAAGTQDRSEGGAAAEFTRQMKKISLLYCHAVRYARQVNDKTGNAMTPEHVQAATSSIFIEACKRNLLDIVCGLDEKPEPAKPAPAPATDRSAAPARHQPRGDAPTAFPAGEPDDVPF